jgi:integrase
MNFRARGEWAARLFYGERTVDGVLDCLFLLASVRIRRGNPLTGCHHWFIPAVREAGIRDFKRHDPRHTFASRSRQPGVPLETIAELLGHKSLAMTKRYAHLAAEHL